MILCGMLAFCRTILWAVVDQFRPWAALEAEILVLRQQIVVLRRGKAGRLPFSALDRMVLGWVCHLCPKVRGALAIVRPDTVVRWHRVGLRCYWRFKSRRRRGHPGVPAAIRQLIWEMSIANPLWGAPRIHGELLKLGIDIGQTSVGKYMARRRGPPSQGWKTFLRNHADGIAAMDLFVVPTVSFRLLYGLLVMAHGRRQILSLAGTPHPTAEWIANQLTAACGWEQVPPLSDPRSRCVLWRDIRPTRSLARDSRSSNLSPLTLAKWLCGAPDWLDPPRMSGSYCGDRRAAPSPHPPVLPGVLQYGAYPPCIREGRAHSKGHSVPWEHRRSTRAWRTAPSIRSDLICDRDSLIEAMAKGGIRTMTGYGTSAAAVTLNHHTDCNCRLDTIHRRIETIRNSRFYIQRLFRCCC